jgi:hypothetical protein
MGILVLAFAQIFADANQNAKQVEAKLENGNLKSYIISMLSNNIACRNTFNSSLNPANLASLQASASFMLPIAEIKNESNVAKVSPTPAASLLVIAPLNVTEIFLTNYDNVPATVKTGDLTINTNFRKSLTSTFNFKPMIIPINFTFDASGSLATCSYGGTAGGGTPTSPGPSGGWLLLGNTGTDDSTDFLGTTDNKSLIFKVNNLQAGRLDSNLSANKSTFFGVGAGASNTTGNSNTVIGYKAMELSTTGSNNIVIGANEAPHSSLGNNNIIIGAGLSTQYMTNPNSQIAIGFINGYQPLIYGETLTPAHIGIHGNLKVHQKLEVEGNVMHTIAGTLSATVTYASDVRLKEKIEPLKDNLSKISNLSGYSFFWKDKEKFNANKQIGLLAQEVEKVFPELITKNDEGYLTVSYSNLIAPVIGALKELHAQFLMLVQADKSQNKEIELLKSENTQLKSKLKNLDERINKMELERKKH